MIETEWSLIDEADCTEAETAMNYTNLVLIQQSSLIQTDD